MFGETNKKHIMEVIYKKIEDTIQRAVEEIVDKEMYFYCNSCQMYFPEKELEQKKYCKFCGKIAVDLKDYVS